MAADEATAILRPPARLSEVCGRQRLQQAARRGQRPPRPLDGAGTVFASCSIGISRLERQVGRQRAQDAAQVEAAVAGQQALRARLVQQAFGRRRGARPARRTTGRSGTTPRERRRSRSRALPPRSKWIGSISRPALRARRAADDARALREVAHVGPRHRLEARRDAEAARRGRTARRSGRSAVPSSGSLPAISALRAPSARRGLQHRQEIGDASSPASGAGSRRRAHGCRCRRAARACRG